MDYPVFCSYPDMGPGTLDTDDVSSDLGARFAVHMMFAQYTSGQHYKIFGVPADAALLPAPG
eukprot:676280-Amphidinium_carterae.2